MLRERALVSFYSFLSNLKTLNRFINRLTHDGAPRPQGHSVALPHVDNPVPHLCPDNPVHRRAALQGVGLVQQLGVDLQAHGLRVAPRPGNLQNTNLC